MRSLGVILVTFLLLALLSPFLYRASVVHYTPDLVLCIVVFVGLTSDLLPGLFLALVLGLLKDGFAGSIPVGLYMEVSVLAFLVSHRLSRRLAVRGPLAVMALVALFSLGASGIELVLSLIFVSGFVDTGGPTVVLAAMAPQALATAPFAPILFWIFDRLDGLVTRRRDPLYPG
jgi:rod shape-determining protein MreD